MVDKKSGKKNIWLLGGSSLFNDIGSEMITPLLPFYVASFGGGGAALGLLSGLREGLASLLKLIGGWLSDFFGKRKPFVFFGYAFSSIFRALLALASTWSHVIALISFERFGKVRDAPRDVIITRSTNKRGKGFALHQALDSSGAIIGTILVILLFWLAGFSMKHIIITAAIVSLLSLVPLFFVKDSKTLPIKRKLFEGIHKLDKRLKYFIFASAIFTFANFGIYMFLVLRAKELTGSIVMALVLYAVFNLFYALFAVPFGRFSDRVGRKKVLIQGYFLFLLTIVGFILFTGIYLLFLLFAVFGIVYAMIQSNQKAYVSDISGKMKGTALGFYSAVVGIVNIPAGLIAGLLWDKSPSTMFYYVFAIGLVALVLLYFVKEGKEFKN